MSKDEPRSSVLISRDPSVEFNWREFSAGLVETIANFALKGWADGGVSGLTSLVKLFGNSSVDEPVEARAWRLVALCFAWSLDELKGRESLDVEQLRLALREAIDRAKNAADTGTYVLTNSFLSAPASVPIYKMMRDVVIERRVELGIPDHFTDNDFRYKLDIAFNLAVLDIWSGDPAFYGVISEHLSTPVTDAGERELSWRGYRQHLTHAFEVTSTFGQESTRVSLSQIYVPLRAYWSDEGNEVSREWNSDGRIPKFAHVDFIDDTLDAWAKSEDNSDWLRLIGGGPGSGKSTTLRAFARRLAAVDSVRPLFIPLQNIGVTNDLRAAINKYFVGRSGSAFTKDPLSRISIEEGAPLVLIFDGLDELVAPNENAKETISLFIHKLNGLITDLRGDKAVKIKVIVSGRMLAFQSAKKLLTIPAHGCLEVYGYLPASQRGLKYPSEIWELDQRKIWWEKYADALGLDKTLPEAFSAIELQGITHEPLLAYLLVLAGFSSHNWERAAENPNRIYATLMSDIYKRGWGDASSKARVMSAKEFNLLMQTIGLAAWLGGDTRVVSEKSFISTVSITKSEEAWDSFNADQGPDVTNLAMNFYLKASDQTGRGFEFTHKSFGEYLAALAIVDVAVSMKDMTNGRMNYALIEWFDATGSGILTSEIFEFLHREIRLRWQEGGEAQRESLILLKSSFEKLVGACMETGFPYSSADNWRVAEKRQLNAEAAAWAIINAVVRAVISTEGPRSIYVDVPRLEGFGVRDLLLRHAGHGFSYAGVSSLLAGVRIKEAYFFGNVGRTLNISYCKIENMIMEGNLLYSSDFRFAEISRMNIYNCTFNKVCMDDIKSESAIFSDCKFVDCTFNRFEADLFRIDEETVVISYPYVPFSSKANAQLFERDSGPIEFIDNLKEGITYALSLSVEDASE